MYVVRLGTYLVNSGLVHEEDYLTVTQQQRPFSKYFIYASSVCGSYTQCCSSLCTLDIQFSDNLRYIILGILCGGQDSIYLYIDDILLRIYQLFAENLHFSIFMLMSVQNISLRYRIALNVRGVKIGLQHKDNILYADQM